MNPYRFSMEKVLDWRSDQEEAAQRFVKEKESQLALEQNKLERILSESRRIKNENLFNQGIDHLKRHSLYKDMLDDKIIKQKLSVQKAQKELEAAQTALQLAHQDKKVMQKLEEKEQFKYKELVKKKEQSQLDEISTLSFGRPSVL